MRLPVLLLGLLGAGLIGAVSAQVLFPTNAPVPGPVPVPFRLEARIADLEEQEEETYRGEVLDFVAAQDVQLTSLLGADKFERLMEMTGGRKR